MCVVVRTLKQKTLLWDEQGALSPRWKEEVAVIVAKGVVAIVEHRERKEGEGTFKTLEERNGVAFFILSL